MFLEVGLAVASDVSRVAAALAAPMYVFGTSAEKSMSPYSSAVPVPFTLTYWLLFVCKNVGSEPGEVFRTQHVPS